MGMTKSDALEAQKSFESLEQYVKEHIDQTNIQTRSKASIAIKAAIKYLKKNASKVNKLLDNAIEKVPFITNKTKNKWKAAISIWGIIETMSHYADWASSVEDAISKSIVKISPIPSWAANIIAKTITLLLPI